MTLYYFAMESCYYCLKFKELWNSMKSQYGHTLRMRKVLLEKEPNMIERYGVTVYPTLMLEKGGSVIMFSGNRTRKTLTTFLKKHNAL